jgi:hypothetical protein
VDELAELSHFVSDRNDCKRCDVWAISPEKIQECARSDVGTVIPFQWQWADAAGSRFANESSSATGSPGTAKGKGVKMADSELISNDPSIQACLDRIKEITQLMQGVDEGTQVYEFYKLLKKHQSELLIERLNQNLGKQMPTASQRRMPGRSETVADMIRAERDAQNKKLREIRNEWYKTLFEMYRLPPRDYHIKKVIAAIAGMAGGAGGTASGGGILGSLFAFALLVGATSRPAKASTPQDPRRLMYYAYLLNWLGRIWNHVMTSGALDRYDMPLDFDDWTQRGCPA